MSTEYYFKKWKTVLGQLERIASIDVEFQESTRPDKKLCRAVERLNAILTGYLSIYNDIMDCKHHNLQVQKNLYIHDIVQAVDGRIKEINSQLSKMEGSNYRFPTNGLNTLMLTPDDVVLNDVPERAQVSEEVRVLIRETRKKVEEERERKARKELERQQQEEMEEEDEWWNADQVANKHDSKDLKGVYAVTKKLSEETIERKRLITIICAHEKARQVRQQFNQKRLKRERWAKELGGEMPPPLPDEVKAKGAKYIQTIFRAYFQIKRNKISDCIRNEMVGFSMCRKPIKAEMRHSIETSANRIELRKKYEQEYKIDCEEMKKKYYEKKGAEIAEDYRDEIRAWFQEWHSKMKLFYDIPKENQGGSTLILQGVVPTPEEYNTFQQTVMEQKKKNKYQSPKELKKKEALAAKQAAKLKKQEETRKKRAEEKLMAKIKKNPTTHPGFLFPKSIQIETLLEAIKNYHERWDLLDEKNTMDIKERHVRFIEMEKACAEVKTEIRPTVDETMRNELKTLKVALAADYEYMELDLPEVLLADFPRITPKMKKRKLKEPKLPMDLDVAIEHLIEKDIIKDYPRTTFRDFKGESNYIGDEIRCDFKHAAPHAGETKTIWWEKCRDMSHGLNKILLVGPKGSGKTTLVHIMATLNDAVLLEVDLRLYADEELVSEVEDTGKALATCARAAQPCIIHIKHVHRLYYKKNKIPRNEVKLNVKQLKTHLIKKMFKLFQTKDKITIIGSCEDPWLTQSGALLKKLPCVILTPDTTYNTTYEILRKWVLNNRMIPKDLDITTLAYTLKGYRYEYLKEALNSFPTAERIVRMAAYGLNVQDVFDYVIGDVREEKTDYEKYQKWYWDKTSWGKVEKKHLKGQKDFQALERRYQEAAQKKAKKNKPPPSRTSSIDSLDV